MSSPDRNFALFLVVVFVALAALFYELFPKHGDQGEAPPQTSGAGPSAPGTNPAGTPQQK